MDWGRVLLDVNGRIGPQTYWLGVLVIILGNTLLTSIPLVGGVIWLGLIWVGIAIYGKRLHDAGRSAWVHAIPWVITSVLMAIGFVVFGAGLVPVIIDAINEIEPDRLSIGSAIAGIGGVALFGVLGTAVWVVYTIWVGTLRPVDADAYGPKLD